VVKREKIDCVSRILYNTENISISCQEREMLKKIGEREGRKEGCSN